MVSILTGDSKTPIAHVISEFFNVGRLKSLDLLKGGYTNTNYEVITDDGSRGYVLREYSTSKARGEIELEHRILRELATSNISPNVPHLVTLLGSRSETIVTYRGRSYCLFKIIPGKMWVWSPYRADILNMRRFIHLVVKLHKAFSNISSGNDTPAEGLGAYVSKLDSFLRPLRWSHSFPIARTKLMFLQREARKVCRTIPRCAPALVHADLTWENVLVHRGKVRALLDFENCKWLLRPFDVAVVIREMASYVVGWENQPIPDFNRYLATSVLDCYQYYCRKDMYRPLSKHELELIPWCMKLVALNSAVWSLTVSHAGRSKRALIFDWSIAQLKELNESPEYYLTPN